MIEAAAREDFRPEQPSRIKVADMAPLIGRVRQFLAERRETTRSCRAPYDLALLESKFGFAGRKQGAPDLILAEDTAAELGHPATVSQAIVLSSWQPELIRHAQVSIVGPDLETIESGSRLPFAQVVMLALREGDAPDPFEIDNAQYLIRRLPGYMVRSVPGRLWARVSRRATTAGLTMKTVGSALIAAYTADFEAVAGVEVLFVTSGRDDVEALSQIAHEASILAGKHKKLVLGADGEVECTDLDCESCEQKPVCDNLRDIIVKRRNRKR